MGPSARGIVIDKPGPVLSADFSSGVMPSFMTFARASGATSGTYLDANGSSYTTYTTGQPRFMSGGVKVEPAATNRLLNSTAPVTQTTASLATGTYCLWVIGSGSATSSAGTATGSGFGTATAGAPNVMTLTGAGTVTVTVAGSLDRFQLELATAPTTFIVTAGAVATRAVEQLYCTTSLISPEQGILMADFTLDTLVSGAIPLGLSTNSLNDTIYQSTNSGAVTARIGGVSIGFFGIATPAAGRHKYAISYRDGVLGGAADGFVRSGPMTSPAPYTPWASRLSLGCNPYLLGAQITGTVHGFKLYRHAISPEFLGALTR